MLPDFQIPLPGPLIPQAPAELVMGLGKNEQKLYLLPSRNLVIVRMGNGAGSEVPIVFDRAFWPYLTPILPAISQSTAQITQAELIQISPNPIASGSQLHLPLTEGNYTCQWLSASGSLLKSEQHRSASTLQAPERAGLYFLKIIEPKSGKQYYSKVLVQ